MRRELLALEPNLVFVENQTMEAEVDATLFPMRASAWLVSGVGLVAMLLAAIGLYGVIAYSVARRTREIGIRIALGARPGAVVGLVMRQGLLVALAGLIAGCLLAAVAARAIAGVLYGVSSADPLSWLTAAAVLLGGVGAGQPRPGLARGAGRSVRGAADGLRRRSSVSSRPTFRSQTFRRARTSGTPEHARLSV